MNATNNFYIEELITRDYRGFTISSDSLFDVHIDLQTEEVMGIVGRDKDLQFCTLSNRHMNYCKTESTPNYVWRFTNMQRKLYNASKLPFYIKGEFPKTRGMPKSNEPAEAEIENPVFKMKPKISPEH